MSEKKENKINASGSQFEKKFEIRLHEKGFHIVKNTDPTCIICGLNGKNNVIRQYRLKTKWGDYTVVDYAFKNPQTSKFTYIECRNQEVPGTVDEKLCKYLMYVEKGIYQDGSFFVYFNDGCKARQRFIDYLKEGFKPYDANVLYEKEFDKLIKHLND